MTRAANSLRPHGTRLFPKNRGANTYAITGVAARCDWVVLSDHHPPHIHLHRNRDTAHPRHIFLSLRAPARAIRHFAEWVLPKLTSDFVLITGSEDVTLPLQTDARWQRFDPQEQAMLACILDHPNLVHWYAENLDADGHAKRSPLPLGLVFPEGMPDGIVLPKPPALATRPPRALCAHRNREGPQWQTRRDVTRLARGPWRDICTVPGGEMPEPAFMAEVERHGFVICTEGGGLDPSPKAWSALLHGAVPIIRDTPLAAAYAHLPVVVISDWTAEALSRGRLARWQDALRPWFDDPPYRREVLHRLSADYWWRIIAAGRPVAQPGGLARRAGAASGDIAETPA